MDTATDLAAAAGELEGTIDHNADGLDEQFRKTVETDAVKLRARMDAAIEKASKAALAADTINGTRVLVIEDAYGPANSAVVYARDNSNSERDTLFLFNVRFQRPDDDTVGPLEITDATINAKYDMKTGDRTNISDKSDLGLYDRVGEAWLDAVEVLTDSKFTIPENKTDTGLLHLPHT